MKFCMRVLLLTIFACFATGAVFSYDIRIDDYEPGMKIGSGQLPGFVDAQNWLKRRSAEFGDLRNEAIMIVGSAWGGMAVYKVSLAPSLRRPEEAAGHASLSVLPGPDRKHGAVPNVVQVCLLPNSEIEAILKYSDELGTNVFNDTGYSTEAYNWRKESFCVFIRKLNGKTRVYGISSNGSESEWKSIDRFCRMTIAVIKKHFKYPEILR